jgi:C_GCAxxG_C_C family probable redox protein
MDRVKAAQDTMASRKANCAQSVLTAFGEDHGLKRDVAYSIAQGFGGGMHINGACGAVTGAYMALGLANPISKDNPRKSMEKTGALIAEFNRRFKEKHGALNCTELLGYDLSKPEEAKKAFDAKVFDTKCSKFVTDAAQIVEDLLQKN